ncbi:phosphate regulon sensor protein PhoR [Bacterioplanes sanyensis]|nr:phosphate regulon sensor protein PhoR [Bacterioplanes sanyensis]
MLLFAAAGLAGHYSGHLGWALFATSAVYIGWQWLQLARLHRWLVASQVGDLPITVGIWGEVFRHTQRLQRRSRKHHQRLQAVINRIQDSTAALQDAVLMADSHGNLEWWNAAASRYLGLRSPTDIGQPLTNLIRNPDFKQYFDSTDYREPLTMTSPVNPRQQLQFNITLFGRKDRLILVHDVTRLVQLEQMRKDFVANVSHELRTPLTVIRGYVETLQGNADMLPPRWQRMLSQMSQQSQRMEALITDLLTLSHLETDRPHEAAPVALAPLLQQICADARALSGERAHQIECQVASGCALAGYDNELRSAFSNLVFNAVKYTPAGGRIEVGWRVDGNEGILSVSDSGEGIAEHHWPRLTERFYRADPSRNPETGGTGLGLAIVKHVLLRHDGRLSIDSTLGQGSTFCCHFPLARVISPEQ